MVVLFYPWVTFGTDFLSRIWIIGAILSILVPRGASATCKTADRPGRFLAGCSVLLQLPTISLHFRVVLEGFRWTFYRTPPRFGGSILLLGGFWYRFPYPHLEHCCDLVHSGATRCLRNMQNGRQAWSFFCWLQCFAAITNDFLAFCVVLEGFRWTFYRIPPRFGGFILLLGDFWYRFP